MAEIKLTQENFKALALEANLPVIVDFWAAWCGPCQMLAPVLAEIAAESEGKLIVGKVNVDEEPELASMYGVASIPTVLLLKGGTLAAQSIGYRPKAQLLAALGI